jgi:hypothetical protein
MNTLKYKNEILRNKTAAISIAILLIISMGASLTLMPSTSAHSPPWNITLYAFTNANPPLIGLGQSVNLGFWMSTPPATANGPYGDRYGPYYLNITNTQGTNQTLGPFISDDTGGSHYDFTPPAIGTYTAQMWFTGMTLTGTTNNPINSSGSATAQQLTFLGDYIMPVVAAPVTFIVQQQPVSLLPNTDLPSTYWQTPVNGMNVVNWNNYTGPWLAMGGASLPDGGFKYNESSNYNPYTTVVNAAHMIWTRPEAFGGVMGGAFPGATTYGLYWPTPQYDVKYNPIIINGYLIFTETPGAGTYASSIDAVDLYTGQTIWSNTRANYNGGDPTHDALVNGKVTTVVNGQVLNFIAPNQYGGIAYFWTTGTPDWITARVAANSTTAYTPINTLNGLFPANTIPPLAYSGATPGIHLQGTTYNLFDAMTGKYVLSIVNGTGLQKTVDDKGSIIGYYLNSTLGTQRVAYNQQARPPTYSLATNANRTGTSTPSNQLEEWNSTLCIENSAWGSMAAGWSWNPPTYGIVEWQGGVEWSTNVSATYTGSVLGDYTQPNSKDYGISGALSFWAVNSGYIILQSGINYPGIALSFQVGSAVFAGYNANTGQELWIQNMTFQPFTSVSLNCQWLSGSGLFITEQRENGNLSAYDMATGNKVWSNVLGIGGLNLADTYNTIGSYVGTIAGNDLIMIGFGGDVFNLNLLTGALNWYTNTTNLQGPAGTNTPYGVWPIWEQNGIGVGDGKIILEEGHEYSPPTFLGAQTLVVNETTGSLIWKINGFDVNQVPNFAYGVMTLYDGYNSEIEAFGQGPSSTTVSAPSVGVTTATPITITGSVMDVSAGAKQEEVAGNFPNGLPAVSDASMSQFMEAVYMQQPMPHNTTGVPVTISVIDSNGNSRVIGTTTSDATGKFALTWTPDISGNYAVTATFAGSGGYYGSKAQTYFTASEAATPAPTNAPPAGLATNADLMIFIVGGVVAIIVAIAIATVLILRKRP